MRIRMRGQKKTFKDLRLELDRQTVKGFKAEVDSFERDLRDETPVDTGEARDSWRVNHTQKGKARVYSEAEHMPRLNDGWSDQAPANFIEEVALRHGKPVGVVSIIDES